MGDLDPVTEVSKEVVRSVSGFMGSTVGELIKDRFHYYRWKHAQRLLDRAEQLLTDRGAKGKKTLPTGLAIRFLDSATLEEEPEVQELWALLLANAVDPERGYDLSKTHICLLTEMNSLDASVLGHFRTQGWLQFPSVAESTNHSVLDCAKIASDLGLTEEQVSLCLVNLWRLGCLIQDPTWESGVGPSTTPNSAFRPSPLGRSVLNAVDKDAT